MYTESPFFQEAVYYVIYSTSSVPAVQKGSTTKYYQVFPFGDEERDGGYPAATYAEYGSFMTTIAQMWGDRPIGQWAR